MLLFLDLDGVLRRQHSALYRLDADCLAAFEDALRWIPDADVVITSTWREVMSLPELRALFSEGLQGRIVGVTPMARLRDGYYRHQEVLAYLRLHGLTDSPWIAIDDDPEHYPAGCEVLLIDPNRGFGREAARDLVTIICPRAVRVSRTAAQPRRKADRPAASRTPRMKRRPT